MKQTELEALLTDARRVRIGVIGDFCLDAYWHLDPALSEISIETGLATRGVRAQRYSLGGAGNVANNLAAIKVASVSAFGVIGNDPFGREMARLLSAAGIDINGLLRQDSGWSTPVYIKPVEGETEQGRIDMGGANALDKITGDALLAALKNSLGRLDLVIVNQQLPRGIHTPDFRIGLASLVKGSKVPFLVDSRSFSDAYDGALRKLNDREALRLCGLSWSSSAPVHREVVERAAETLFSRWGTPLFVTRGPRGILVRDSAGTAEVPGLQIIGRIDTVGAGDSALAGIAAALAAGRDSRQAAEVGNFAAGVSVRKLFITGTASPEEILACAADAAYVHEPELAEDSRSARYHDGTDIEVVTALPHRHKITHVIFDYDGTISTLREGWEKIMGPVMIRCILGERWKEAEASLYQRVRDRVHSYIDATTGVQTLFQMQGLVEMVKEFGLVPPEKIKDPHGYKAEYDVELRAMVGARVARLTNGSLTKEDFMLKGVPEFLEALNRAGVRMWLASGTDEEDVLSEVRVLGNEKYFGTRVFGAVGDLDVEAKRVVMERIAAEVGEKGFSGLVTFGDGPVEIRETRRRGGYAIGVASDEPRRYGWNQNKRARVIRAGADLVIPDFLCGGTVLQVLGISR
ncbi:MAG TPA: PfkB family carbohydrate kinase [Spirochaetia bacterium]|nr:PfkB family carbohydrate kinase [Spirochaetia bacterium]